MKQSKNTISDWLDKHGNPEIAKLVEQQAREIMAENARNNNNMIKLNKK
jgi:hypothetical protein